MNGIRTLIVISMLSGVAMLSGCGSDGNEKLSSDGATAQTEQAADARPLDTAAAELESEGFTVERSEPGDLNVDEFEVNGGGALGDAVFRVLAYDDPNVALTEGDAIAKVFTGNLANRGKIESSADDLVLYQVIREGKPLKPAQISEFQRLMALVEESR